MLLPIQIQAILYHFLAGWLYALGFSFFINFSCYFRFPFMKGIMEVFFHLSCTSIMFYGLYQINGGITNMYLIGFFIFGVFIYITFYFSVFLQLFTAVRRFFRPFKIKLVIAKSKIVAIIKLPGKIRKRRKAHVRCKKHNRKKQKKKKESDEDPD